MPISADLSKLSNVVKNDVVKKTDYNKLVTISNNIDTSGFILKTKYQTGKTEIKNKLILVVLLKRQITILKLLK